MFPLVNSTKFSRKNTNSSQILQKIEEERTFPNSFYKASIIMILNSNKDSTRRDNYKLIFLMNTDAKSSTKFQQIEFNNTLKDHTPQSRGIYSSVASMI